MQTAAAITPEVERAIQECILEEDDGKDGRVNRSLTHISLNGKNGIQGIVGRENVVALASRCTNLERLYLEENTLHMYTYEQHRKLDLLYDRKRLCTEASALAGSPFSVLFRFMKKAHRHSTWNQCYLCDSPK
jgi:hypothetical protein